jgi:hypothetical protein
MTKPTEQDIERAKAWLKRVIQTASPNPDVLLALAAEFDAVREEGLRGYSAWQVAKMVEEAEARGYLAGLEFVLEHLPYSNPATIYTVIRAEIERAPISKPILDTAANRGAE